MDSGLSVEFICEFDMDQIPGAVPRYHGLADSLNPLP